MAALSTIFLFAIGLLLTTAFDCRRDGSVYEVTSQNFDEITKFTQDNDGALVVFYYRTYTDLISNFYIEFQKAAQILFQEGDKIYFAKSSWNPGLNFKEMPSVYVFASNEGMKFRIYDEKEKTADDFVKYFRRIVPQGPKEFSTIDEFNQLRLNKHHSIVGFFDSHNNNECKSFIRSAPVMRYLNFMFTTNIKLGTELGIASPNNTIALFYTEQILGPDEPKFVVKDTNETLFVWVYKHYLLPVDIYTLHSSLFYEANPKQITMLILDKIDLTNNNSTLVYYRTELNKLADQLSPLTHIAIASQAEWKFLPYKLDTKHPVELASLKDQQWHKWLSKVIGSDLSFKPEVFVNFTQDVYHNRTVPFVMSQPVPAQKFKNGIMQLVGSNFEAELARPGHEFFIMFSVTWNPRCHKFRKEMEKLANTVFKDVDYIHFAEIDESENYIPEKFVVGEMPTLYFVKENYKPMIYKQNKTAEQVTRFIERYSNYYKK